MGSSSDFTNQGAQPFWCEYALVTGNGAKNSSAATGEATVEAGVLIEVMDDKIVSVTLGTEPPSGATELQGLTVPGLANTHSHAFHRALRGQTHEGTGSFWTWRDQMYEVAQNLTPDSYYQLARAVYGEMVMAGITAIGEFHYVHHQPNGTPYDDSNAMGLALLAAAADAGVRITLFDTAYLRGGIGGTSLDGGYLPVSEHQQRFSDGSAGNWTERVGDLLGATNSDRVQIGAALHSVRALNVSDMAEVARFTSKNNLPLHVHLSETLTENHQCQDAFAASPTELLEQADALSPYLTAVHATHMANNDIDLLSRSGSSVCMCPTTERDLADGIGPSTEFVKAGVDISLGSDSHAVIDMFEEARAVELNERLLSRERGNHTVTQLASMATRSGYRALGWTEGEDVSGGGIAAGQLADFVSVRMDSVRTAGSTRETVLASVIYGASPSDIDCVVVGGELIAQDGRHKSIDVATELATSIAQLRESD